jgi:radical SAM protein with 4Fe4S-binding SPASM domain
MTAVRGCFERTICAINYLREQGVTLQLGTTVTSINHADLPRIKEFAEGLGLPLEVSPIYAVGWARKNQSELLPLPMSDIVAACKEHSVTRPARTPLIQITRRRETYAPDPVDYEAVDLRDFLTEHHECGQKIVAILANGTVTPCLMLRDEQLALGSLQRNTLSEILSGQTAERPRFDALMQLAAVPECNGCEARYVCKAGGCSASAYALTGSVQRKNPLYDRCYYAKAETRREMGLELI